MPPIDWWRVLCLELPLAAVCVGLPMVAAYALVLVLV